MVRMLSRELETAPDPITKTKYDGHTVICLESLNQN